MAATENRWRIGSYGNRHYWIARIAGILLFFIGWSAIAVFFPAGLMPFPLEAIEFGWEHVQSGRVWVHLAATMSRIFWGFLGGMALGIFMGVMMGVDEYERKFLTPHIVLNLSIPHLSWGVAATLVFGFDILSPIVASILAVFPFVAVSVWKGVEDIDGDLLEMAKSFELSFGRTVRRVILPNVAPSLMSASQLGLAMAWKTVVLTEVFAAGSGIGYKMFQAYQIHSFPAAWGWATVFMVVILIIEYGIFKRIRSMVFDYRRDVDFSIVG